MLNLFDPVRFSVEEQTFIDSTLKPLGKDGWSITSRPTKKIKHHISEHTIIAQGGRCAYCEEMLVAGAVDIEHIAPKEHYGEFTYEPYNLVSSCTCCNAICNKGREKTIVAPVNKVAYDKNKFSIVHPYFDNPDDHIKYLDKERTLIDYNNCSNEGKATIGLFDWNSTWAYCKRLGIAKMRHYPLPVLKLAAEIATYKEK